MTLAATVLAGPGSAGLAADPTLENFGTDPIWLVLIKVVAVFAFLVVMTLFSIVFERKVVARMQNRVGPNRVGPRGSLQSLADGLKLAFKEDIMPALADKPVYFLAPILSAVPAFLAFCVIPFGPMVSIFGHQTPLQLTDLPVGVLIVFACSAVGVYGIILSGWASGSTYPLLGGLRSAAQVISYEIAMGLSLVAVFLYANTMSTSGIVAAQAGSGAIGLLGLTLHTPSWYAVLLLPSFLIYSIAVEAVGIVVAMLMEARAGAEDLEDEDELADEIAVERGESIRSDFPTPPMDLVVPPSPRLRAREPVTVPAAPAETDSETDPTGETR